MSGISPRLGDATTSNLQPLASLDRNSLAVCTVHTDREIFQQHLNVEGRTGWDPRTRFAAAKGPDAGPVFVHRQVLDTLSNVALELERAQQEFKNVLAGEPMSDTALQQLLCHLGDAEREMLLERQRAQNWAEFNVGLDKLHDEADREAWEAQEAAARAARSKAQAQAALHALLQEEKEREKEKEKPSTSKGGGRKKHGKGAETPPPPPPKPVLPGPSKEEIDEFVRRRAARIIQRGFRGWYHSPAQAVIRLRREAEAEQAEGEDAEEEEEEEEEQGDDGVSPKQGVSAVTTPQQQQPVQKELTAQRSAVSSSGSSGGEGSDDDSVGADLWAPKVGRSAIISITNNSPRAQQGVPKKGTPRSSTAGVGSRRGSTTGTGRASPNVFSRTSQAGASRLGPSRPTQNAALPPQLEAVGDNDGLTGSGGEQEGGCDSVDKGGPGEEGSSTVAGDAGSTQVQGTSTEAHSTQKVTKGGPAGRTRAQGQAKGRGKHKSARADVSGQAKAEAGSSAGAAAGNTRGTHQFHEHTSAKERGDSSKEHAGYHAGGSNSNHLLHNGGAGDSDDDDENARGTAGHQHRQQGAGHHQRGQHHRDASHTSDEHGHSHGHSSHAPPRSHPSRGGHAGQGDGHDDAPPRHGHGSDGDDADGEGSDGARGRTAGGRGRTAKSGHARDHGDPSRQHHHHRQHGSRLSQSPGSGGVPSDAEHHEDSGRTEEHSRGRSKSRPRSNRRPAGSVSGDDDGQPHGRQKGHASRASHRAGRGDDELQRPTSKGTHRSRSRRGKASRQRGHSSSLSRGASSTSGDEDDARHGHAAQQRKAQGHHNSVTHQLDDGHTSRKGSTAANGHRHGTLLSNPFDLHGPAPWATDDAPTNDARHAAHGSSNRPKPKRHSGEDSEGHGHVSSRRVRGRSQKRHARHRRPHSSSGSDVEDNGEVTRLLAEQEAHRSIASGTHLVPSLQLQHTSHQGSSEGALSEFVFSRFGWVRRADLEQKQGLGVGTAFGTAAASGSSTGGSPGRGGTTRRWAAPNMPRGAAVNAHLQLQQEGVQGSTRTSVNGGGYGGEQVGSTGGPPIPSSTLLQPPRPSSPELPRRGLSSNLEPHHQGLPATLRPRETAGKAAGAPCPPLLQGQQQQQHTQQQQQQQSGGFTPGAVTSRPPRSASPELSPLNLNLHAKSWTSGPSVNRPAGFPTKAQYMALHGPPIAPPDLAAAAFVRRSWGALQAAAAAEQEDDTLPVCMPLSMVEVTGALHAPQSGSTAGGRSSPLVMVGKSKSTAVQPPPRALHRDPLDSIYQLFAATPSPPQQGPHTSRSLKGAAGNTAHAPLDISASAPVWPPGQALEVAGVMVGAGELRSKQGLPDVQGNLARSYPPPAAPHPPSGVPTARGGRGLVTHFSPVLHPYAPPTTCTTHLHPPAPLTSSSGPYAQQAHTAGQLIGLQGLIAQTQQQAGAATEHVTTSSDAVLSAAQQEGFGLNSQQQGSEMFLVGIPAITSTQPHGSSGAAAHSSQCTSGALPHAPRLQPVLPVLPLASMLAESAPASARQAPMMVAHLSPPAEVLAVQGLAAGQAPRTSRAAAVQKADGPADPTAMTSQDHTITQSGDASTMRHHSMAPASGASAVTEEQALSGSPASPQSEQAHDDDVRRRQSGGQDAPHSTADSSAVHALLSPKSLRAKLHGPVPASSTPGPVVSSQLPFPYPLAAAPSPRQSRHSAPSGSSQAAAAAAVGPPTSGPLSGPVVTRITPPTLPRVPRPSGGVAPAGSRTKASPRASSDHPPSAALPPIACALQGQAAAMNRVNNHAGQLEDYTAAAAHSHQHSGSSPALPDHALQHHHFTQPVSWQVDQAMHTDSSRARHVSKGLAGDLPLHPSVGVSQTQSPGIVVGTRVGLPPGHISSETPASVRASAAALLLQVAQYPALSQQQQPSSPRHLLPRADQGQQHKLYMIDAVLGAGQQPSSTYVLGGTGRPAPGSSAAVHQGQSEVTLVSASGYSTRSGAEGLVDDASTAGATSLASTSGEGAMTGKLTVAPSNQIAVHATGADGSAQPAGAVITWGGAILSPKPHPPPSVPPLPLASQLSSSHAPGEAQAQLVEHEHGRVELVTGPIASSSGSAGASVSAPATSSLSVVPAVPSPSPPSCRRTCTLSSRQRARSARAGAPLHPPQDSSVAEALWGRPSARSARDVLDEVTCVITEATSVRHAVAPHTYGGTGTVHGSGNATGRAGHSHSNCAHAVTFS